MKLILTKDVHGTGKAGEIVNVSDGYARNFLIPKGLATVADANSVHAAELRKSAAVHKVDMQRKNAHALAASMTDKTVKVYAKAGDNGKLFGSIGAAEIAAALKEQYDLDVDKKKIRLDEPIKALGVIKVTAHLYEKADAKFSVEVLPVSEKA